MWNTQQDQTLESYRDKATELEKELDVLYDEKRKIEASINQKSELRKNCLLNMDHLQRGKTAVQSILKP